jgi:hypothetical protein
MTNNKQQTAVEWFGMEMGKLFAQYHGKIICIGEFHKKRFELEEQAKEMEKEQIIQAYSNAWHDGQDAIIMTIEHIDKGGDERGLKYYEQL